MATIRTPGWQPPPGPLYAQWRRRLEEETLRYERQPHHACWMVPAACVDISTRHRLFGCLECGRTHTCLPPYDSCLQRAMSEASVCIFSGRAVVTSGEMPVGGGTYESEIRMRDALRAPPLYARAGLDRDPRTLHALDYSANFKGDTGERKHMYARIDALRELQQSAANIDAYTRHHKRRAPTVPARRRPRRRKPAVAAATAADHGDDGYSSAADHGDDDSDSQHHHRNAADDDSDDAGENYGISTSLLAELGGRAGGDDGSGGGGGGGGGGGDDEEDRDNGTYFVPSVTVSVVDERAVPDLVYDDAYMNTYLAPVLHYLRQHGAAWAVPPPPAAKPPPPRAATSVTAVPRLPPPPWPWWSAPASLAVAAIDRTALRPHQRVILETLLGFFKYYEPEARRAGITAAPLPLLLYMQQVDRALLLFQWFAPEADRLVLYAPPPNQRRPVVQHATVVRAVIQLLTQAFVTAHSMPDAFGTMLPLWVAEPWLAACARVTLFVRQPWPPAPAGRPLGTRWVQQFRQVLTRMPVSVFACQALLHGQSPVVAATDAEDGGA